MSRHEIATSVVLLALLSCSASVQESEPMNVFRAKLALESEQMRVFQRQELGCDPCSEVTAARSSGAPARYLVSADPILSIQRDKIGSATIHAGENSETTHSDYLLMIELSDDALANLAEVARLPAENGANYYRGELLGVGPLLAFGSYYVVGYYESKDEATRVSTLLGVEPSFVPYDEQSRQRVEKRLRDVDH